MKPRHGRIAFFLALAVFLLGFIQGLSIAIKKPLWTDEIFTQVSSVEGRSWSQILMGNTGQGNNSPLFYSIQKAVCSFTGYRSQDLWHQDEPRARVILRLAPVFFMSLGIALCVWYFTYLYSLLAGVFVLILSLTTYMIWAYWGEARPYSMVFYGTVFQALALWNLFRFKDRECAWRPVMYAHLFLALTSALSVIQLVSSGIILWLGGYRRLWKFLAMVGIPLAIAVTYYAISAHYKFWFAQHGLPIALIRANIPEGRLHAILFIPVILWIWDRKSAVKTPRELWLFQGWVFFTLLGYIFFLSYLWFKQKPPSGFDFEISNRYLMSLAPLGIISMVFLSLEIGHKPRVVWKRFLIWGVILALTIPRLIKVFSWWHMF